MKFRLARMLVPLVLITGCAATMPLSGQMSSWQGQQVGVAISTWGQPDAEEAFGEESILIWQDRAYQFLPGDVSPNLTSAAVVCERMLAVSAAGTITGWRWRGDACPTLYAPDARVIAAARH